MHQEELRQPIRAHHQESGHGQGCMEFIDREQRVGKNEQRGTDGVSGTSGLNGK